MHGSELPELKGVFGQSESVLSSLHFESESVSPGLFIKTY